MRHDRPEESADSAHPTLFELRRYRTRPGCRDTLIALFETVFLDLYEASGARILGTFRDVDDPDRWVWIRAFANPEARGAALERFYGHPEWQRLRSAANATILDSRDACLLANAADGVGRPFPPEGADAAAGTGLLECWRLHPRRGDTTPLLERLTAPDPTDPALEPLGLLATASCGNSYPRQPLRRRPVVVLLRRSDDPDPGGDSPFARHMQACDALTATPTERFRLCATDRSRLR